MAKQSSPLRVSISTLEEGRFVEVNESLSPGPRIHPRAGDSGCGRFRWVGRHHPHLGTEWSGTTRRKVRDGASQTTSISAGGDPGRRRGVPPLRSRSRRDRAQGGGERRGGAARGAVPWPREELLLVREEDGTRRSHGKSATNGQALTGLKLDFAVQLRAAGEARPRRAVRMGAVDRRALPSSKSRPEFSTEHPGPPRAGGRDEIAAPGVRAPHRA